MGPREALSRLARVMEDGLLQNGEASLATREAVQQAFGVTALNMSFATLGDLCALLRVQLEGNGLLPLWDLLEQAWFERPGVRSATLEGGNRFLVAGDHAHTLFYTFDDWAQFGPGRTLPAAELGEGYRRWARLQRQYAMALEAYGLHVRWVLANPQLEETLATVEGEAAKAALREIPCLSGDYLVEAIFQNDSENPERHMTITNQADPELGTLAYTVMSVDANGQLLRLEHHYPLRPQGLNVIIDRLVERCTEQGTERQVLHPGRLLYSETGGVCGQRPWPICPNGRQDTLAILAAGDRRSRPNSPSGPTPRGWLFSNRLDTLHIPNGRCMCVRSSIVVRHSRRSRNPSTTSPDHLDRTERGPFGSWPSSDHRPSPP